jgi:hypothetical protein
MKPTKSLAVALAAAALLAWGVAACGDLPVKANLPPEMRTVSIPTLEDKSGQPGLATLLTQKIVQGFIVDGRLKVAAHDQADAELKITVQRYDRLVLTFSNDIAQVPQQYKLQVAVDMDFIDLKTGKQLWSTRSQVNLTPGQEVNHDQYDSMNATGSLGSLKEFTNYYVNNNVGVPPEDESHAMDRLMDQMADRVVRRTVYGY